MAGNKSSEIRVAGTGKVLVAPVGTAAPGNATDPWSTEWVDLGYTTTDGIKFNKKDKIDPVDTWQSVSPARFIYSDRDLTVKFQLLQFNDATLPFFMGGGAVTGTGETFTYEIASAPRVDERALGIEFSDGDRITYRFIMPRGQVTETEELGLSRTAALKLGVTFTALAETDADPLAIWIMKDPAYAAG